MDNIIHFEYEKAFSFEGIYKYYKFEFKIKFQIDRILIIYFILNPLNQEI